MMTRAALLFVLLLSCALANEKQEPRCSRPAPVELTDAEAQRIFGKPWKEVADAQRGRRLTLTAEQEQAIAELRRQRGGCHSEPAQRDKTTN